MHHCPHSEAAFSTSSGAALRRLHVQAFFLYFAVALLLPSFAYATTPLTSTICSVVTWMTGPLGRNIATLGIVVLAIGALMGKVSWGMAFITITGIGVMFSSASLVEMMTDADVWEGNPCLAAPLAGSPLAVLDALCTLNQMASGATGKALATISIVALGVGALMGKISAPLAILLTAGIGGLFGAETIAREIYEANGLPNWALGCP